MERRDLTAIRYFVPLSLIRAGSALAPVQTRNQEGKPKPETRNQKPETSSSAGLLLVSGFWFLVFAFGHSSTNTVSEATLCFPAALIAFTTTTFLPILLKLTSFLKWPLTSTSTSSSLISTVAPASVFPSIM